MSSRVLSGRRQVFPVESHPVIVPGYQLTFDMAGLPYWEPGFGTIKPVCSDIKSCGGSGQVSTDDSNLLAATHVPAGCQVGAPLHCIAHLITRRELNHILNTEGGNGNPDFGYQLVDIVCETYSGQAIVGVSLVDIKTASTGYRPSARYHKIVLDGATEHGLSPSYIKRLEAVPPYVAKTAGQRIAKYLFLAVGLPLSLPVIVFAIAGLVFGTKVPRPVSVYGELTKRAIRMDDSKQLVTRSRRAQTYTPHNGSTNNFIRQGTDDTRAGDVLASRYTQIVIKEPSMAEPKRAKRKRITAEQLRDLTAVFGNTDTPTHDIREVLSKKLGMTNREVQVWFQNRRAKFNRQRQEQQRQLRTNAAIIYSAGMAAAHAPLLAPPPPTTCAHLQPRPSYPPAVGDTGGQNGDVHLRKWPGPVPAAEPYVQACQPRSLQPYLTNHVLGSGRHSQVDDLPVDATRAAIASNAFELQLHTACKDMSSEITVTSNPQLLLPLPLANSLQPRTTVGEPENRHNNRILSAANSYPESPVDEAKLAIDMLATAAVSVSSARSSCSLPHLTPLSEFSLRAGSQQQNSPVPTPSLQPQEAYIAETKSKPSRSWRPW
ncbi:hypothetical protein GGI20_002498 [Coemansia sp. BCRC 34301]|nr:hypothetical protein GGI20_002498 [Coemansia sp. BCRC 34301]